MAKMYPPDLTLYRHTATEAQLFNAFKSQLSDNISVFFSVSWISYRNEEREQSECDFLIFDPAYGFLTCEVKGGVSLFREEGKWILKENETSSRVLNRSPMEQAEESLYYFRDRFREEYRIPFNGISGAIVCFPRYIVDDPELLGDRPAELVLDARAMSCIASRIKKAFLVWKNNLGPSVFTPDQKEKFIKLVQKRIAIAAAAGALIGDKERELASINRVQDNYVYLLSNYKQVFISGGAGTGKTWIAIKFGTILSKSGKKVLVTCFNSELANFIRSKLPFQNVTVLDIASLIDKDGFKLDESNTAALFARYAVSKENTYDAVIVDEAQDCDAGIAAIIRMHLADPNGHLYVFYDKTQNLYERDFENGFLINNPPFLLRENLRNTASISEWAKQQTSLGSEVITNQIHGPCPERLEFASKDEMFIKLEDELLRLIEHEFVDPDYITIVADGRLFDLLFNRRIGKWVLSDLRGKARIKLAKVQKFKGLESNVIFYLHSPYSNKYFDYVAFTRAKFYLFDYIVH